MLLPAYEIRNPSFPDLTLEKQIEYGCNDWVAVGKDDHGYVGETKEQAEANRAIYE